VIAPAYTTRAQAAAPDAYLVRQMASVHFNSERRPGSSGPDFDGCAEEWQAAACKAMVAAILAAEALGYEITQRRPGA
jgi:hypothetical protein